MYRSSQQRFFFGSDGDVRRREERRGEDRRGEERRGEKRRGEMREKRSGEEIGENSEKRERGVFKVQRKIRS